MSNYDIDYIKSKVSTVPDFPKKGIIFRDMFPVFRDPLAVEMLIGHMVHRLASTSKNKIDVVVGLDARGFLFGPLIALRLGAAFVPVRKSGKLCGDTFRVEYALEYGTDAFEIQKGAIQPGQNVVIVDDLIATGGSAFAAGELVVQARANVNSFLFVMELIDLKGRDKLQAPVYSVLQY
ncbi:adenine phosphoribosyltransferase [Entomophthora muscae]|uniref:Adenine phosphoribosyltransferase n=1 Tax=Entomophthora muscae TaxID=34485 RepID=A0ACC2TCS1_9FUNG|nr:adenine phosphoribosyltransferase [Entomophthora muscae]